MRLRLATLVCAAAALALSAQAGAAGFEAGAAGIDISPLAYSAAQDPNGFAARCPPQIFGGRRIWADDEPYIDLAGAGHYVGPSLGDPQHGVPPFVGDPYCDANGNGRYDAIYSSGGSIGAPKPATALHDPLEARALAFSDGRQIDVVVSVAAQGLFNTYIDRMAAMARQADPQIANVVVQANHNEGSPDTIGIYGGPSLTLAPLSAPGVGSTPQESTPAGLESGIDDYYMSYLVAKVAGVAVAAAHAVRPATLWADQFTEPADAPGVPLAIHLSDNWPTTEGGVLRPTAIDPKIGVLQAREAHGGRAIFTAMSLAAHNQEVGQRNSFLSADWPGYFQHDLDAGGTMGEGVFLVADNGSEEDPETNDGTPAAAAQTGADFAQAVEQHAPQAQQLRFGPLRYAATSYCAPLENNLFKAAAAIGLFGQRHTYLDVGGRCIDTGLTAGTGPTVPGVPDGLETSVALLDVGPDLQLIANPGEAFPALMLGSPWSETDVPAACQDRPNPPVPVWYGHALFRFSLGLANDFLGYELPAWADISAAGAFTPTYGDFQCVTGSASDGFQGSKDAAGHNHKLETEGVGPTSSNLVATQLTALLRDDAPDPAARVAEGRYVLGDGSTSERPGGAVGILVASGGPGTLIGDPTLAGLGTRAVDTTGVFMDYDGQPQAAADITTRGMMTFDNHGCVAARYYLNVYPPLASQRLGSARMQPAAIPNGDCANPHSSATPVQHGAAAAAGLLRATGLAACSALPRASVAQRSLRPRRGRVLLAGVAQPSRCGGRVVRVSVEVAERRGARCRYLGTRLGPWRSCRAHGVALLAHGTTHWALRLRLPRGRYRLTVRAIDASGLARPSVVTLHVV